jgi:hypothetical protein
MSNFDEDIFDSFSRHCERREAIHASTPGQNGLLRYARNGGFGRISQAYFFA